jgi:hypothetical protein
VVESQGGQKTSLCRIATVLKKATMKMTMDIKRTMNLPVVTRDNYKTTEISLWKNFPHCVITTN